MRIQLTNRYTGHDLRRIARRIKHAGQARRLVALAAIYDGAARTEAAAMAGVTVQIIRDWVIKLNAHGPDGLIDRHGGGTAPILSAVHRQALAIVIEDGPVPAVHGVVRWRVIDLCQWLWDGYAVKVSKQTLSRELRAMGYRRLSARPRHHALAKGAISAFKKVSPRVGTRSGARRVLAQTARGLVCR